MCVCVLICRLFQPRIHHILPLPVLRARHIERNRDSNWRSQLHTLTIATIHTSARYAHTNTIAIGPLLEHSDIQVLRRKNVCRSTTQRKTSERAGTQTLNTEV